MAVYLVRVYMLIIHLLSINGHAYQTEYLDDSCDKIIRLNSSSLFSLSKEIFYRRGWKCTTTLEVKTDYDILLKFEEFDVGRPSLMFCTDVLRIYDGQNTKSKELTPVTGLCGRTIIKPYESTDSAITLKFKSGYMGMSTGFKVLATVIKKNEDGKCASDMFKCEDGYCIYKSAVCDSMSNCIDGSDESAKHAGCIETINRKMTKWTHMFFVEKVGVAVGLIALILIIIFVCYFMVRLRHIRRKRFD